MCLETLTKDSNSSQSMGCVQALSIANIWKLLVILHFQHWASQQVDLVINLCALMSLDASYFDLAPLVVS